MEWLGDLHEGNIFNRTGTPLDAIGSVRRPLPNDPDEPVYQQLDRGEKPIDQIGLSSNDAASQWLNSPDARLATYQASQFMKNEPEFSQRAKRIMKLDDVTLKQELEKVAREVIEGGVEDPRDIYLSLKNWVIRQRAA